MGGGKWDGSEIPRRDEDKNDLGSNLREHDTAIGSYVCTAIVDVSCIIRDNVFEDQDRLDHQCQIRSRSRLGVDSEWDIPIDIDI